MNEWKLGYADFDPPSEGLREALCTLGNGYFATRGAAPESRADGVHYPGTYLAGAYNRLQSEIAGRTVENEDLVNLPNWLPLNFRAEGGEWFDPGKATILSYDQELDLQRGILTRTVRFRDAQRRTTTLTQRRLVSMDDPHLAALQMTLLPEDWSGRAEIRSALDGSVINDGVARYRAFNRRHLVTTEAGACGGDAIQLKVQTSQSELRVALAARHRIFTDGQLLPVPGRLVGEVSAVAQHFELDVAAGRAVTAEKIVALFNSRDVGISECGLAAREAIAAAPDFDVLVRRHERAWARLWERFGVELDLSATPREQCRACFIIRLHVFHLLQTTSPHTIDLDAGVPARGWHGEAYRGHVFWDEVFIFPLLNFRIPDVTRALLQYRHRRLGAARRAAREAGFRGAMFPWQSGSDGREETQRVHLNPRSGRWLPDHSRLQRHVNAAIAYNVWHFFQITGDLEFLCFYGAEMLLEIARFWASLAVFNEAIDRYEIRGVMGPDEYHDAYPGANQPGLRNNAYTNLMAVWGLCRALDTLKILPAGHVARLREKLELGDDEIALWQNVSRKMRLVFHGDQILSQFEGYGELEELDWDAYRTRHGSTMRLDRILEAEGDSPNRYQASKQADVLMLLFLFSNEELQALFERLGYPFDPEMIRRNIDYYRRRTSHGSTLSQVVESWVLARLDRPRSWQLLMRALESDVADVQGGTTAEGIHLGAMAGTVDLLLRGYTGLDARENVLWLNPRLPDEVARLAFKIRYREASLSLEVTHRALRIHVANAPTGPVRVGFRERVMDLGAGEEVELELAPAAGEAGALRAPPSGPPSTAPRA